jgi:hypothetical protein
MAMTTFGYYSLTVGNTDLEADLGALQEAVRALDGKESTDPHLRVLREFAAEIVATAEMDAEESDEWDDEENLS